MKILSSIAIVLVLGVVMLSPGRAMAQSDPSLGGPAVVQAWVDALAAHDIDAALLLLGDESFLIIDTPDGEDIATYSGKTEIGRALQVYVSDNVRVRLLSAPQEENDTTFWTESRTSDKLDMLGIPFAEYTGQALVVDGMITSIIYTPTPETEAAIARALGVEPTGMPRSGAPVSGGVAWATWVAIGLWSLLAGGCLLASIRREERRSA